MIIEFNKITLCMHTHMHSTRNSYFYFCLKGHKFNNNKKTRNKPPNIEKKTPYIYIYIDPTFFQINNNNNA